MKMRFTRIATGIALVAALARPALGAGPEIEMVYVKGGCFQMGDIFGDGSENEKPVHKVCVDDFSIGKYMVTQAQYEKVMGKNPSHFKKCGLNCPVEKVSWNDVKEFIRTLNAQTGKRYRLPTEAEWEYAARSGGKSEKWAGTNKESDLWQYSWYAKNSDLQTNPVGQKRPNGLGIYDMSGNVWQLVEDYYKEMYSVSAPQSNPTGPESGTYRVLRGGCWREGPMGVRTVNRGGIVPSMRDSLNGFRLALPAR